MSGELKHKMYDYEVNPPQSVWDSIANELNEDEQLVQTSDPYLSPLVKKMHAYEVAPPAAAWRNIKAALKAGAPVKSIALRTIYRWSAAAGIILLAGAYYFLNYSDTAKNIAQTKATVNTANGNEQMAPDSYSNANDDKAIISAARLTSSSRYNRRKVYDDEEEIKILPLSYVEDTDSLTGNYYQSISVTPRPILTSSGELIQDKSVINPHNDKYISITAPNGQQTKISSRLINAMQYFSSSNNTEKKETDKDSKDTWQQRIHQWRNKILQSAFVPSSSNFLDILEMTELVDDSPQ